MRRILGNAQLKTHFGREGILFCMASKSGNYLNPHLTMKFNEVTCKKCLKLLNNVYTERNRSALLANWAS